MIIIISNTKKVCTFCPCTKTYLIILDNFILSFIIKMFFVLIYNTIHFSFYLKIFLKLKKIKFIDQKNSRVKIKKYCIIHCFLINFKIVFFDFFYYLNFYFILPIKLSNRKFFIYYTLYYIYIIYKYK